MTSRKRGAGGSEDDAAWPPRYPYPAYIDINGKPARGRDISHTGISAHVSEPFEAGAIVAVRLGWVPNGAGALSGRARVVRCEPEGDGHVVALEFLSGAAGESPTADAPSGSSG